MKGNGQGEGNMMAKGVEGGNHGWSKHVSPFDSCPEFMREVGQRKLGNYCKGRTTKGHG